MYTGKKVLVTGASSGIGQAIAIGFGRSKCDVFVNYHSDREGAERTLEQIREHGGNGQIVQADVGNEKEVIAMFDRAIGELGPIDVLVNNAGIQRDSPISSMSLADWNKVIATNLTGHFLCAREAIRCFDRKKITAPSKAIGNIIFISSVHDVIPWAGHVNYASAKGGIDMLMRSIAQEVAPRKIRVNAISPGAIATDINSDVWNDEEKRIELLKLIPYGRIGEPDDVAKVALWLASDESDYVTGTTIYVDGGMTLYPAFADNG